MLSILLWSLILLCCQVSVVQGNQTIQRQNYGLAFQSLSEPLLEGQLVIQPDWPDLNAVQIFVTMDTTILCSLLMLWTYFRMRKLSVAMLVLQQVKLVQSVSTEVPSFIYRQPSKSTPTQEYFKLDFDLAWDHVIFILCLLNFVCFLLNAYSIIRRNNLNKSMLKLEITSGDLCVVLSVIRLPLCPVFCRIELPHDVSNLSVHGPWYARKLYLNWNNFSVTNTLTNHTLLVPEILKVSFLDGIKLKKILEKPFFVFIHVQHNGFLRMLTEAQSDISHLIIQA